MSKGQRKVEWSLDLENLRVRAGQFVREQLGEPAELKRLSLQEKLAGATAARILIENPIGRTTLGALAADSPNLFQAELQTAGDCEFDVSGGGERVIRLRPAGKSATPSMFSRAQEHYCDIKLARGLPLVLELRGGIGKCQLDLSHLQSERCRLETGVGEVTVTAPLQVAGFALHLIGGVGKAAVRIPAGGAGRLKIAGGLGGVKVSIAPGAALSLNATVGLGQLELLAGLESGGAPGNWQTPGFADAANPIEIEYSGGVGSFSLDHLDYFETL